MKLPPGGELPVGLAVGEFRITGKLGQGGMGAVYAAVHPVIGKRAAVKVLAPGLASDPEVVRRFVDEARVVNRIGHPNIIDVFAFGELSDGRHYFVMEFLDGKSLDARLGEGPLSLDEARRFLAQACSALEAAHDQGVVHRDLKPENIWVAMPKHGDSFVKLLDFGIAKLLERTDPLTATKTGMPIGTPYYMSPEQCLGKGVDHRTDVYAMGVILYQMFTGHYPFEGDNFVEVITQQLSKPAPAPSLKAAIDPHVEEVIVQCLEKDPGKRPQSMAILGKRLANRLEQMGREGITAVRERDPLPGAAPRSRATPEPRAVTTLTRGTGELGAASLVLPPTTAKPRWAAPAAAVLLVGAVAGGAVVLRGGGPSPTVDTASPVRSASTPARGVPAETTPGAATRPAQKQVGRFRVKTTNADNARFLLDDVEFARGVREAEMNAVESGRPHRLRVEAPGMKAHEREITVPPGATADVPITLEAEGAGASTAMGSEGKRSGGASRHRTGTRAESTAAPTSAPTSSRPRSRDSTVGDDIFK